MKLSLRNRADSKLDRRGKELVRLIREAWKSIQTTSLDVGKWLCELRDSGYWRKTHATFGDFRDEVFGISERYAQFLIKGAETVLSLPPRLRPEITTESQARALANAPADKRESIVEKLCKNGGVTAEKIEKLAAKEERKANVTTSVTYPNNCSGGDLVKHESKPASKPKIVKPEIKYDSIGIPIPDDAIPYWNRRQEVQDILTQISRLKSVVVGGREAQDHQWLKVTNAIENTFDSLRSLISEAKPYAVCTTCMGSPSMHEEGCNFCKSTGLISEWQWNTQSRKEVKDMMLRRAADLKKERENVS